MLTPLPVVLAAVVMPKMIPKQANWMPTAAAMILASALLTGVMAVRWEVTQLEWPPPEQRPFVTAVPQTTKPVAAVFDNNIHLLGYTMDSTGAFINLTLYWQARSRPSLPYTVFIHAAEPAGKLVAQQDSMPQNGNLPTTCWRPGEIVADTHQLVLPEERNDPYAILIGLYDARDGGRLSTAAPDNAFLLTSTGDLPQ